MNPFSWLRTAARNAVLGGIQDAVEQVSDGGAVTVRVELPALPEPVPAVEDRPAKARRAKEQ